MSSFKSRTIKMIFGLSTSTMVLASTGALASSNSGADGTLVSALDVPILRPRISTTPLSMDQAMSETLTQSPRAASLRLELSIAKAGLVRAKQLPNPTLLLDNGYKAEFTYRYGVAIPLEQPWKLALRIIAAKKQIVLADLEISKALWILRGDIRRAYVEALLARERQETLTELFDLYQQLVEIAEKKFKAGDVAGLDVSRTELGRDKALINRNQVANEVLRYKQSMNVLLGRTHDLELEVPRLPAFGLQAQKQDFMPDLTTPLPPVSVLIKRAIENRLEIKIIEQSIRSNNSKLKLTYANILPNPVLGVGRSIVNGPPNPGNQTNFHGFFLQGYAELPIFNYQQGDISLFRSTIKQLQAELMTQQNIVELDVVQAFRKVFAIREKISAYQKILAKSDEVARLTRKSYEVGETDIASVLLAQEANVQTRNEYLDTVYAYEIAYTDLEQSIGTSFY